MERDRLPGAAAPARPPATGAPLVPGGSDGVRRANRQRRRCKPDRWIQAGREELLLDRYAILVNQQVVIGLLLLLAWGLNRAWRWNALLVAPFAVVFAISLAWLPQEYGKLALSNKFPQALIRFEHPAEATGQPAATLYLVDKTDNEFVLWDAHQRKIVWVATRVVASAEISGSRTLSQIIRSSEEASQ